MKISILTVFSNIYDSFLETSLIKKAQESGLVSFDVQEYFSFCEPKERIDTPTFGHGAGMVIKPIVVQKGIESQDKKYGKSFKIFLSPDGKKLDQKVVKKLSEKISKVDHLMFVSSRYEGQDCRVEEHYADEVISIGDFVLMGGDLPVMILIEALLRYVPGVVGKQESVLNDSFSGPFVDYPKYAPPIEWMGSVVPEIVRSGDHAKLDKWRRDLAAKKTVLNHFDWLSSCKLDNNQKKEIVKNIPSHYVALMHNEIILEKDRIGTTSVASLDLHDIARSAKTYGLKNLFIVTPLKDQQKIVNRLFDFWKSDVGLNYNQTRFKAIESVVISNLLDDSIAEIEKKEGKKPILIATSARDYDQEKTITYFDQAKIWEKNRPILFVFGTGRGLSDNILNRCDYVLAPIEGFSDYKHLSVRSAAAIVFDRWLGINIKFAD